MATYGDIWRSCERKNRARHVQEIGAYSMERFWRHAQGHFAITGGSDSVRADALGVRLRQTLEQLEQTDAALCVVTTSPTVEKRFKDLDSVSGRIITSADFANYRFFYGWNAENILDFFSQAARLLSYDSLSNMVPYMGAFLRALSACCVPELSEMCAMAQCSDHEIRQIGERQGVDQNALDIITRNTDAGDQFRKLLDTVATVFSPLSVPDGQPGYALSAAEEIQVRAFLINIRSDNPQLMDLYFSKELLFTMNRFYPIHLTLSDISLSEKSPWYETLDFALSCNATLGFSVPNLGRLPKQWNNLPKNRVILLDRQISDIELKELFNPMGTYTRYVPVRGGSRNPGLITLFKGDSYTESPEPDFPRVQPEDVRDCAAVLEASGFPDIILTRSIHW